MSAVRCPVVSDNVRLSARQSRFIGALIGGASMSEAAAAAGVVDRTARRWLSQAAVRGELARCTAGVLSEVAARLVSVMAGMIDVLDEVAHDESASAAARTGAARAALDAGLRLAELVSLSDRVAALEARQDQEQARRDDLLSGGLRSGDI